ncbi:hypothetical protein DFH09DRAFT_1067522 [Mycena vulgaris]|nr:hypothetical protein DFH09DRAFT_1067522 [Mycena vulgaris]
MLEARARADGQMGRVEVRWGVGDMCATQKRWDTVVVGGARVSEKGALVSAPIAHGGRRAGRRSARRRSRRAGATAPHRVGGGEKERRGSGADDAGEACTCGEACKSCGGGVGRSRRRRRVEHAEKASRRRAHPSPSSLRCPAGGGERGGVWDAATATRRREAADAAATRGCRFTCHPRGAARWGVDACRCAFLADGWGEDKRRGVGENASSSAGRSFFVSSKAGGGRRAGEALMCGGEYEGSGVYAGGRRQRRVDSPCTLTCRWLEGVICGVVPPSFVARGGIRGKARRVAGRHTLAEDERARGRGAQPGTDALEAWCFLGVGTLDGVRAGAEDASSACIGGCPRLQLARHDVYGLEDDVCTVRGARVVLSPLRARGGERHVSAAGRAGAGLRPLP